MRALGVVDFQVLDRARLDHRSERLDHCPGVGLAGDRLADHEGGGTSVWSAGLTFLSLGNLITTHLPYICTRSALVEAKTKAIGAGRRILSGRLGKA